MDEVFVTVFRSAEHSAQEEAEEIRDLLEDAGLSPVIFGEDEPGVPSGAVEVRVPAEQSSRADALIDFQETTEETGDPSPELDMEVIYEGLGTSAEMEAIGVKSVLDANGIPAVLVGNTPYPNLPYTVRVPKSEAARARQVLADAEAAGPAGAAEAELAGEE